MHHPVICIGQTLGYVFKGLTRDTFAFVPEGCVTFNERNSPAFDEGSYIRSGWDIRNMRFNENETFGSRLFPDVRGELPDLSDKRVNHFVDRLKHAYEDVRA